MLSHSVAQSGRASRFPPAWGVSVLSVLRHVAGSARRCHVARPSTLLPSLNLTTVSGAPLTFSVTAEGNRLVGDADVTLCVGVRSRPPATRVSFTPCIRPETIRCAALMTSWTPVRPTRTPTLVGRTEAQLAPAAAALALPTAGGEQPVVLRQRRSRPEPAVERMLH